MGGGRLGVKNRDVGDCGSHVINDVGECVKKSGRWETG